jgi:hypothetical protein
MGRKNLWAELSEQEWSEAKKTGHVAVVYLPEKPEVNHPAKSASDADPVGDATAGLGVLVVFSLGFLLGSVALFVRLRGPNLPASPKPTTIGSQRM